MAGGSRVSGVGSVGITPFRGRSGPVAAEGAGVERIRDARWAEHSGVGGLESPRRAQGRYRRRITACRNARELSYCVVASANKSTFEPETASEPAAEPVVIDPRLPRWAVVRAGVESEYLRI